MSIYEHVLVYVPLFVGRNLVYKDRACANILNVLLCIFCSSVCFHKVRPYKALTIIVLSIDFGAWVYTQDSTACLKAGCGLTPTKFPKHRSPRRELFWGVRGCDV